METIKYGIRYNKPEVYLLKDSGLSQSEIGARVCYDSFENSEHQEIKDFQNDIPKNIDLLNKEDVEGSNLLDGLAWVHFHHSILEHSNLTYFIKGTSRGVLAEITRHRIASYSVRSTRYTMSNVINAFVASLESIDNRTARKFFFEKVRGLDMLVISDVEYISIETDSMWEKLKIQYNILGKDEFHKIAVAKSSLVYLEEFKDDSYSLFKALQEGNKKRNVGDGFKHIVSDNWKVDMVVTFNIRSLKNYFDLRDSGAAWFQIQWLAQSMKEATPKKYLKLIDKKYKENNEI